MSLKSLVGKVATAVVPTKAKIENVGATLKAAVTGKGVQSNTGVKVADKVLSAAASNPFISALPIGAASAAGKLGVSGAVSLVTAAPKTAALTTIVAPAVVSAAATTGLKKSASIVADIPKDTSNFASNLVSISSLEDVKDLAKENPVLTGAVIAGAAYVAGKGVTSAVSGIANTIATKENTKAIKETSIAATTILPTSQSLSSVPLTPQTQVLGKEVGSSRVSKRITSPKGKTSSNSNSLRVNIYNQSRLQNTKFIKLNRY